MTTEAARPAGTVATRQGPSALGDDLRRFWELAFVLAITEFKLRYFGSFLGYFWTLMRPLMLFGVLYFVFTQVVRFGDGVAYYPLYLLMAVVLWTYFSEVVIQSVRCLVNRERLIRKIRFPRMVVPLSVALTSAFTLGTNLLALFAFLLASGITPRLSWLELPVLLAVLIAFATGVAMLLSALFVRFRDIEPISQVGLQLLFYGSPVIYVIAQLPDSVERFMAASPIAAVITEMRYALIDPAAPTAADALGGGVLVLIPLAIAAAVFALGLWVFNREAPFIAENL
ncbi:MAG: ABC transporter permease [Thermoleophilaceae bacterium]